MAVLKQCGFSATIFLAPAGSKTRPYALRVSIISLGVRYANFTLKEFALAPTPRPIRIFRSLSLEQIDYELGFSKEVIEQKLGTAVESFSYPFAFPEEDKGFTRFLVDVLENLGFHNGVSTVIGRARQDHNRFFLPRLPVNSWDDPHFLRAKIEGGYDWLHWPQWFNKLIHHNVTMMQRTGGPVYRSGDFLDASHKDSATARCWSR